MNMSFFRRINLVFGIVLITLVISVSAIGLIHTPYNPYDGDLLTPFSAPSAQHWFGTDDFGRDELSRLMVGGAVSLSISAISVMLAVAAGTAIGVLAGYAGGWWDRLTLFLLETVMAFPSLLLALAIMTVIGPSKIGLILALGLSFTPSVARLARGAAMSIKHRDYVVASRVMGNPHWWTIVRHVLPNCVAPLIVFSTALFGSSLLAGSALSFLGLGVPPPAASWGGMLADSRNSLDHAIWLALAPGGAITVALLGINFLGDAVRDWLDPRMNGVRG
jgi:peptide/nickel transport system permease protein